MDFTSGVLVCAVAIGVGVIAYNIPLLGFGLGLAGTAYIGTAFGVQRGMTSADVQVKAAGLFLALVLLGFGLTMWQDRR